MHKDDLYAVFLVAQQLAVQDGYLAVFLAPDSLQQVYWREAIRICDYRTVASVPVAVEPL